MIFLPSPPSLRLAVTVNVMDLASLLCPRCRCELRMFSSLLMKRNLADKMPATSDVLYISAPAYWVTTHYSSHSRANRFTTSKCTILLSDITSSTGREGFLDVLFWTYLDLSKITALLSAHDRLVLRMIANLHRVMKPWNRSLLPTFADVVWKN